MKIHDYVVPKTTKEAYELLQADKSNTVIGGGAWIKMSTHKEIHQLIDLKELDLNTITSTKDAFIVGANVTLHELEQVDELNDYYDGILIQAIKGIMGMGIRNLATIGGSIMGRFSFSDLFAVLIGMDVELEFYHHKTVPIRTFLENKKFGKDILLQVIIPKNKAKGYYKKVQRTALDFAVLNLAVVKGDHLTIAIGARSGIAQVATKTCQFLEGKELTDTVLADALKIMEDEIHFSANVRASKEYRLELAKVYVKRGLQEVMK